MRNTQYVEIEKFLEKYSNNFSEFFMFIFKRKVVLFDRNEFLTNFFQLAQNLNSWGKRDTCINTQYNCIGLFQSWLDLLFLILELMSSQQLRIPDVLGKLWGPLLNILHRTKLTSALVQLMVTMVTDKQNFQNYLLCSWLQKIIRSNASSVDFEERK